MFFSTQQEPQLFGRRKLTATPPLILDKTSIVGILKDVLPIHFENSAAIDKLYKFYCGDQPILQRTKEIRPEIKNIVLENRAFEVVEFKKGFEFSHPLQYTNASMNDSAPVDVINTYARVDSKESKDLELAEWFFIAGTAYRLCLPNRFPTVDEAPYFTEVMDPRHTFVVYSNAVGHKPLMAGSYVKHTIDNKDTWIYGVYTETDYYTWTIENEIDGFDKAESTQEPNTLGMIPIVEYPVNKSRLGYVELCYHLYNAINNIGSNRVDGVEQFVQALLVFINCELPTDPDDASGETKMVPKSGDAIDVKGSPGLAADVKYLIAQLDQEQTQVTKEDLLNAVYEICGVPSRKDRQGGGDTGQAVVLRDGWGAAEARAKSTEKIFRKSEIEYLKIVLRICRDIPAAAEEIKDLTLRDIAISFTRNRNDNMLVKSQTLETLVRVGVNGEDAFEVCELFSDPTAVYLKSKKEPLVEDGFSMPVVQA